MAPEWWFEAWEACEGIYEDEWSSMSAEEQDRAVNQYVLDEADVRREVEKESDV